MKNENEISPEWLASERQSIEKEWFKKRFYGFISDLFREKTTLQRYGLLIVILQLVTMACSGISYMTSHIFTEKYVSTWVQSAEAAFWSAVGIIALIEIVKIIGGTIIFMRLVQWKKPTWWLALMISAAFIGSMYASYDGGHQHITNNTAPALIDIDSIKQYYDTQITAKQQKENQYRTGKEYRNSEGELYHKVLTQHISPLESQITRLESLRDSKVESAEVKNASIESDHDKYTMADASVMAWIALGSDLVKLLISFITARFFLSCRLDLQIMQREYESDKSGMVGEYGMMAGMKDAPPPNTPQRIESDSIVPIKAETSNPRQIPLEVLESLDNSKNSKPCIVVKGFNKGEPMTRAEIKKKLRDTKSRLKRIQKWFDSGKQGKKPGGKKETVLNNIHIFEEALRKFNK